jgi:hypothetical protein
VFYTFLSQRRQLSVQRVAPRDRRSQFVMESGEWRVASGEWRVESSEAMQDAKPARGRR